MKQYLDVVRHVLEQGSWQKNRTQWRTLSVPGVSLRLDMLDGFPALTTRKLAFKSAIGELVGYLRGEDSAAGFRALGCRSWDQNANENPQWLSNPYRRGEDDLGPIYGVQWRAWPAYKLIERNTPAYEARLADARARGYQCLGVIEEIDEEGRTTRALMHRKVDQLRECLHTIIHNPGDRRILFHSWNVAQLEEMALPSCPTLWQFHVNQERQELSLNLFIRSSDIGLGLVWNCAEAAALLHLVARLTGYKARWLSMMLGDAHIYENQIEMLREQLTREPFPLPTLVISERVPSYQATGVCEPEWLERVEPRDFWLEGYEHHPPLSAAMAV